MNEIKLVLLGLVVLVFSVVLLWIFEAPEIIEDKEVEIASALGIGLLILILDKRSERDLHEKIHQQHDIINKMNKLIHEQHEFIMDLGNKRKEKLLKNNYELKQGRNSAEDVNAILSLKNFFVNAAECD